MNFNWFPTGQCFSVFIMQSTCHSALLPYCVASLHSLFAPSSQLHLFVFSSPSHKFITVTATVEKMEEKGFGEFLLKMYFCGFQQGLPLVEMLSIRPLVESFYAATFFPFFMLLNIDFCVFFPSPCSPCWQSVTSCSDGYYDTAGSQLWPGQ